METKQEAAAKYAARSAGCNYAAAFEAGVDWAQKWIAPQTELPPADKVLVKDKYGDSYTIDWRGKSLKEIRKGIKYLDIILWRHINLK